MEDDLSGRQLAQLKYQELQLKTSKLKLIEGLPHKFGWKWYRWARTFYESTDKICLLVAANQISKSSTQIRKCIEWSTNQALWPNLWKTRPQQFWYLYPSKDVAHIEFEKKWVPEFLPKGEFKDHPVFGWRAELVSHRIHAIHFNSGVSVYFKTYSQDPQTLQSSTAHAIFCFTAGTKIMTNRGSVSIESITLKDKILTRDGFKKIESLIERKSEVIERRLNGIKIKCTHDHPFFTKNRGWVSFSELTDSDTLVTIRQWNLIEKLSCLMEIYTYVSVGILMLVKGIILEIKKLNHSIASYGKSTIEKKCLPALLFITPILIPWIIGLKIWSVFLDQSTLKFINGKSGKKEDITNLHVSNVEINSKLDHLKTPLKDIVHKNAGILFIKSVLQKVKNAFFVRVLLKECMVSIKDSVHLSAQIGATEKVYNLKVSDCHEYFANSFLVHNCDEELPVHLFPEIQFRLAATDGYFSMVFTATLNQDFWRRAVEKIGQEDEVLKDALKLQVSMYDCLAYEDGSLGAYTEERIEKIKAVCPSDLEVQRRIYGRFVTDEGRMISSYNPDRHIIKPFPIHSDLKIYSSVDIGSGGQGGHPAAISFIAVEPNFRKGYVFKGWRGDGVVTASSDIVDKWVELKGSHMPVLSTYDWQSKDFYIVASRMGHAFTKADKNRASGQDLLNTLFRNDMLFIFDDGELQKLSSELMSLMKTTRKQDARDDFYDCTKYCAASIPWDFSHLGGGEIQEARQKEIDNKPITEEDLKKWEMEERWGAFGKRPDGSRIQKDDAWQEFEEEIAEWNEFSGN